jgi:hypothetical protein
MYVVIHNSLTHLKKSVHLNGAKDGNCDIPIERETLQPCSYVPRVVSVCGRQGCRLCENGDASREGILRAWVCPNIVDRDGAATFSNQFRKGPAGEEQHKAMVWKIPTWHVPVYRKTRRLTRPFRGEGGACDRGMTSFISKMGLRHTTTTSSAATSVSICHNIGSDARLPITRRCFTGHPDHLIWCHAIFSYGVR